MFAIVNADGLVSKVVSGTAEQAELQCEPDQKCHGLTAAEAEIAVSAPSALIDGQIVRAVTSENSVEQSRRARLLRDQLLAASDWTQVADAPVNKGDWSAYRNALRDVPSQPGFPTHVIWPIRPGET